MPIPSELQNRLDSLPKGGRTRVAPTPSGFLHAGNAVNFLITHHVARASGATVLLRIDDLDSARLRTEYVEDIFLSLAWLGIRHDQGPGSPAELVTNWSQQLRKPRYELLLAGLRASGLLYACTCSRSMLRSTATDGRYPGTCRERGLPMDGPGSAWRLRLDGPTAIKVLDALGGYRMVDLGSVMGDPVLRQRDGRPAYQVASLADDLDFGISVVVRGMDLLPSSACQLHLARLLGLDAFMQVRFLHHPVLVDDAGHKLSKSTNAVSLKSMRERGESPDLLWREVERVLEQVLSGTG